MRWTIDELLGELDADPNRRIVFVEGTRDIIFWRDIVPDLLRGNTVFYAISAIECPCTLDGERGRLIEVAKLILESRASERIIFFADADFDRLLNKPSPQNVVLTDGRDLESYGLCLTVIGRILSTGFGKVNPNAAEALEFIAKLARTIAVARVVSEKHEMKLPFQRTLDASQTKGIKRFLDKTGSIDKQRLVAALLHKENKSLSILNDIVELIDDEFQIYADTPNEQLIHGKDFIGVFSILMSCSEEEITRSLFLSYSSEVSFLKKSPNIAQIEAWVHQV